MRRPPKLSSRTLMIARRIPHITMLCYLSNNSAQGCINTYSTEKVIIRPIDYTVQRYQWRQLSIFAPFVSVSPTLPKYQDLYGNGDFLGIDILVAYFCYYRKGG